MSPMTKEKRHFRNKNKMARRKESPASGTTTLHDVPDKLLELILLHLASPVWLIHAAATCRRWRRIIVDANFPHRFRRQHPHAVAGHYHPPPLRGGNPVFVPTSLAIAVDRRHFSLDFLPGGSKSWKIMDSRGSLLLLAKKKGGWMRSCFPDLIVCEPLTRRHHLIPHSPDMKHHHCLGVLLRLHNVYNGIDFTVICVLYECYTGVSGEVGTVRACTFSRGRRGVWRWNLGRSAAMDGLNLYLQGKESLQFAGRAADSFYWQIKDERSILVCPGWSSWFSLVVLPDHIWGSCVDTSAFRVVGGGDDGKVRIACLESDNLKVFATQRYGDGSGDWVHEKSLNLTEATRGLPGRKEEYFRDTAKIVTVSAGCVVLTPAEETWLFSVDLGTMRVESKNMGSKCPAAAYPYELPWPPPFHACLCPCRRRRQGPCSQICTC